jgi:hypothetical protein
MTAAKPPKKKLLERVREEIRLKHYSYRTEETYVQWIKRYIFFHNKKHPVRCTKQGVIEIEAFLTHLAVVNKVWSIYTKPSIEFVIILV